MDALLCCRYKNAVESFRFFSIKHPPHIAVIHSLSQSLPLVKHHTSRQQVLSPNKRIITINMFFQTTLPILAAAGTAFAAAIPAQSPNNSFVARRAVSGQSTFYGGNVEGGTCSFSTYSLPSGLYGTAFSGQAWDNAANCGGCVEVTHGGKTVTAMVSDSLYLMNLLKQDC